MSEITYGIKITGEASGAKRAFEETSQAQRKLTGAEKESTSAAVESERATERKSAALGRLRLAAIAAGVAVLAMARSSISAAIEAERAQNRLAAVIRATGGAAGVARGEYDKMAQSLMEATQFDDEQLLGAQATLLKFGNIHGDVFRNALRLSADLAAFLGTDVPGAAQMLGKSLQSPTEGLMMMERQFGQLEAAEDQHIKTLVAQGRAWDAQLAVIALWEKKVGGAAQTMNAGLGKATNDVRKEWNELLETIGKSGTIMDRSLQGGASLLKDIRLTLEGTRNPLSELLDMTVEWAAALRYIPGPIGMIGNMANAQVQAASRARRTATGKINFGGGEEEAGLAAFAGPIRLGGSDAAAAALAKERAEAIKTRAEEIMEARRSAAENEARILQLGNEARIQRNDALEKEADAVRDVLNPWNAYAREVERLRGLLEKGLITQREFGDAVALEAKKIGGAFDELADSGTQSFDELKQAVEGWGRDLSRELARGELSIKSFTRLFEELLAMQIQKRIMQPFLNSGAGFLDSLFNTTGVQSASQMAAYQGAGAYTGSAAPFHAGGIVGLEGGARRYVHPAYFEHAPRLHSGGLAGGEVPAILKRGEGVFTPEQMRAMGGGAGNVTVNVINQSGQQLEAKASAPRIDASGLVVDLVLRRLSTDAGAREQLGGLLSGPRNY